MFTVVDLGYFEIRSGSNWICWVCLRRCKLVNFAVKGLAVGGDVGMGLRVNLRRRSRLKPRLYKQNPDGARVEEWAVKIRLVSSVRGGGLPLCRRGFNRRLILS